MEHATEGDLKHLRSLINGYGADRPVSGESAATFYKLLFPLSARFSPNAIMRYANGDDPMPKDSYDQLVSARLIDCD
ncbi:hypothetical protein V0242_25375 (plasmid) [Aeromonas hydrophila]|uniref:hypothetical protein n=1 Tax=Aeromonas hydrophila TaxID=644 RepID=UPI002ED2895B|nr:hypothetical protein V0242_25375 [Aeromonas hydrophila]